MPSTSSKANFSRSRVGQPDDEGGGEELAQPVRVLALAGEDLVALVERLALELDPLFGAAEDVLELLQGAQARLALAVELGDEARALGHLDEADGVAVVVGLAVALAVRRLFLVGIESEQALDAVVERAFERPLRVAVVALAQQRRRFRQPAPLIDGQPVLLSVDAEEGVLGAGVGDQQDGDQRDQQSGDEAGAAPIAGLASSAPATPPAMAAAATPIRVPVLPSSSRK